MSVSAGRLRVAQVMAGAPVGGAEAFYERLCLALHGSGEADVLAVVRREPGREARLRAGGLSPVGLRFGGPLDLATGPRLRAALRGFAPGVVVAWMNRAAGFAPRGPWALVGRLGGRYDLRHYARCDALVANTRGLVDWIAGGGWDRARVHHLPNFAPDLAGAAPATDLPPTGGRRRLLAMGRLHANKGFDTLLRALALPPLADAHLWLAGEGPERGALERLAREAGVADRVAFLGWRTDTAALLAACEVFVVPSRVEPLGNVVLEAMSAGRPVLAAAADGPREVLEDGRTGLLVAVDEPGAMAGAAASLLADPARAAALAAAARAEFEARHAEAPVLARWLAFLRGASAAAAPGRAAA